MYLERLVLTVLGLFWALSKVSGILVTGKISTVFMALYDFTGIYGTFAVIFGTFAEHFVAKDAVFSFGVRIVKCHKNGLLGQWP